MKVKSVNHSKRIPRIHSNWDTMGRLHLCMLYGLASNCMFNCNKETTFAKKNTMKKHTYGGEKIQKQFSWNFAHSWKTQNSCSKVQLENGKCENFNAQSERKGDSRKKIHLPLFNQREWIKTAPKNALSNTENSIQKTTVTKDKTKVFLHAKIQLIILIRIKCHFHFH